MSEKKRITLPRLIGSRETMRRLVEEQRPLKGRVVVINARELRSASPSSADELVRFALVDEGAASLEIHGATAHFSRDLADSARMHRVESRLRELSLS